MLFALSFPGVPGPLQFFTMLQHNFAEKNGAMWASVGPRQGALCAHVLHPNKFKNP